MACQSCCLTFLSIPSFFFIHFSNCYLYLSFLSLTVIYFYLFASSLFANVLSFVSFCSCYLFPSFCLISIGNCNTLIAIFNCYLSLSFLLHLFLLPLSLSTISFHLCHCLFYILVHLCPSDCLSVPLSICPPDRLGPSNTGEQ
jgi:hypothetical protein